MSEDRAILSALASTDRAAALNALDSETQELMEQMAVMRDVMDRRRGALRALADADKGNTEDESASED